MVSSVLPSDTWRCRLRVMMSSMSFSTPSRRRSGGSSSDVSPRGAGSSMGLTESDVVEGADATPTISSQSSARRSRREPIPHAIFRLIVDGDKHEALMTSISKRKKLERPLGKSVVGPFLLAHAQQIGWQLGRAPYILGCVERVEIYGLSVELGWPTRQWAQGDVPVDVVVFLSQDSSGEKPSSIGQWLSSLLPAGLRRSSSGRDARASINPVVISAGDAVQSARHSGASLDDDEAEDDSWAMTFAPVLALRVDDDADAPPGYGVVQAAVLVDPFPAAGGSRYL